MGVNRLLKRLSVSAQFCTVLFWNGIIFQEFILRFHRVLWLEFALSCLVGHLLWGFTIGKNWLTWQNDKI